LVAGALEDAAEVDGKVSAGDVSGLRLFERYKGRRRGEKGELDGRRRLGGVNAGWKLRRE